MTQVRAELSRLGIPVDLIHSTWLQAAVVACDHQIDRILTQLVAADIVESCRPSLPRDLAPVAILPGMPIEMADACFLICFGRFRARYSPGHLCSR